jgi:hypothetical protein
MRRLTASIVAAVSILAGAAPAQTCGANQVFLKNDTLPDVPSGPQAVSVIRGLCEGEAMGAVFDVSGVGSMVKLENGAFGFFNVGAANGIQAVINLKVYDGITWSGATPVLGPEIFDWATVTGSSIAGTTHAINTVDVSSLNIVVTSGKLVVTWWLDFNPNGDCTNGYTSNFGTDDGSGPCSSVPQRNLMFVQGAGWVDPSTYAIGPFNLCPSFYNGNWIMRACVSDVSTTIAYCTAKTNSFGCVPAIGWSGIPSASATTGFTIRGSNVRNQKPGLLLYTIGGPAAAPFTGGFLCVGAPVKRTPGMSSGGNNLPFQDCSGIYQIDMNSFAHGLLGGTPLAALTVQGQRVYAQFWGRDNGFGPPNDTTLTDAIQYDVGP